MPRRRVQAAQVEKEATKPRVTRRTRRKVEKEVSIPLVIKCDSSLCEVLLQSLTDLNSIRIGEQWRNKPIKVPPLYSRHMMQGTAVSGRKKPAKRAKTKRQQQRTRRPPVAVLNPRCKPLLPNKLLLSLAESMGTPGQGTSASSNESDYTSRTSQQIIMEALGAPIEMFCKPPAASQNSNLVMVSTQRGMNGAIYPWNPNYNTNRMELSDPNNIFNHIRNGLAECRLFGLMPFQEDQPTQPSNDSSLMECNMLPQGEVDSAGSNVDIFKHIRNLLSESPICDPPNQM